MKAQKKVAVVSARHLASLLVRLAVVLQTKNARAQNKCEAIANSIVKVLSVRTVPFLMLGEEIRFSLNRDRLDREGIKLWYISIN